MGCGVQAACTLATHQPPGAHLSHRRERRVQRGGLAAGGAGAGADEGVVDHGVGGYRGGPHLSLQPHRLLQPGAHPQRVPGGGGAADVAAERVHERPEGDRGGGHARAHQVAVRLEGAIHLPRLGAGGDERGEREQVGAQAGCGELAKRAERGVRVARRRARAQQHVVRAHVGRRHEADEAEGLLKPPRSRARLQKFFVAHAGGDVLHARAVEALQQLHALQQPAGAQEAARKG